MTFPVLLRREVRALFALPQTYAIAGAFLLISGVFFANILISTQSPDLGQFYSNIATTFVVLLPIVAMRSFAEERRSGALDLTLSWPVSRAGLVVAKFVANTTFAWALVSVSCLYVRIISGLAPIDGARAAGGYFGLLFLILAFSALSLMVSARASSPTAAAFLGFGLLLFLWILDYAPGWIGDLVEGLSPSRHFESFPRGVVYLGDVAWFLTITAVGLGLAIAALGRAGHPRRAAAGPRHHPPDRIRAADQPRSHRPAGHRQAVPQRRGRHRAVGRRPRRSAGAGPRRRGHELQPVRRRDRRAARDHRRRQPDHPDQRDRPPGPARPAQRVLHRGAR